MAINALLSSDYNRRTIRSEVNPMDKSTVFSIYPLPILEKKPTIQPGTFYIPAGSYDNPGRLVVGPSSWWREIDPEQPLLEITNNSVQVADSIVRDYCNGILACDMGDSMPGLFFIPGEINIVELKTEKKYNAILQKAIVRQRNWYASLVKMADAFWSRTNGNPLSISDDMRRAAKELGLDKTWAKEYDRIDLTPCPACGNLRNPAYPVCTSCKTIVDRAKYDKLGLKPAE